MFTDPGIGITGPLNEEHYQCQLAESKCDGGGSIAGRDQVGSGTDIIV
jgi:hypothetical protein